MRKQNLFIFLFLFGILLVGCDSEETPAPEQPTGESGTIKIVASMPTEKDGGTRVTAGQVTNSKDIKLEWKDGDKIQIYFGQDGKIIKGSEPIVENISGDRTYASFSIVVPAGLDKSKGFVLYGVHGAESKISGSTILLDARPSSRLDLQPLDKISIPLYFMTDELTDQSTIDIALSHYGALQVLSLKNNADAGTISGVWSAVPLENNNEIKGELGYFSWNSNDQGKTPVFDIKEGKVFYAGTGFLPKPTPSTVGIPANTTVKLAQWVVPNGQTPAGIQLFERNRVKASTEVKSRADVLDSGSSYHLFGVTDNGGNVLNLTGPAATADYAMTFTVETAGTASVPMNIAAQSSHRAGVWIDINNDGLKSSGTDVTSPVFGTESNYTVGPLVSVYGRVHTFAVRGNVTSLDVSNNRQLTSLSCFNNKIRDDAMTALMNSLPMKTTTAKGKIYVIDKNVSDGNVCTAAHVAIANARNWDVVDSAGAPYTGN